MTLPPCFSLQGDTSDAVEVTHTVAWSDLDTATTADTTKFTIQINVAALDCDPAAGVRLCSSGRCVCV